MLSHFDVPDILIRFLYCYVSMLNFIFYLKSEVTRGGIRGRGRPRGLRSPFSPYFKNVSLKLSNFALRFGHKCSKNAASNISTKLNFRWGWGGGGYVRSRRNFFVPLFLDPPLMNSERLKRPSLFPLFFVTKSVSKKILINNILLFGYSIGRQRTAIQAILIFRGS